MRKLISLENLANLKPETLSLITKIKFEENCLFFKVLKAFCEEENKKWFEDFMFEFNKNIYKQVILYKKLDKDEGTKNIKFNLYMGRYMYYPETMALSKFADKTTFLNSYKTYYSNNEVSPTLYFRKETTKNIFLEYELVDNSKELAFTIFKE
ncbi:hypothetical protein [Fusobacterium polymorphum]|uniref:hypothetical protein n=1 Tax=Fusobacterium nucleatum subsp. polymorphum TaxID=76857 RepID=UPI0030D600CF